MMVFVLSVVGMCSLLCGMPYWDLYTRICVSCCKALFQLKGRFFWRAFSTECACPAECILFVDREAI